LRGRADKEASGRAVETSSGGGYDGFAWLYDREWGTTSLTFVPARDALVLDALPAGARNLDLACGTGQLAGLLAERGFRVTGLDSSFEMLALARTRAPRVDFVQADARSFVLAGRFDAVISVYDSLNHIMSVEELGDVFARVHAILAPGGPFVFDLNTEAGYPIEWSGSFLDADHAAIARSRYDSETRTMHFDTTIFRPSRDAWERTDIELLQRCHAEDEVRGALEAAGFRDVAAHPAESLNVRQAGRLFYAARA
jgi:SAM-dependent methyltransferase